MQLTAEDVVRLFEEDERARRRLAELLISEPGVRLAIINAVLRDVATKSDLERLAASTRGDLERLRGEIKALEASLRGDLDELRGEMRELEASLREDMKALEASLREDMKSLEASLREDMRRLEASLRGETGGLRRELGELQQRVARVEGQLSLFVKLFAAFNLPTLLGVVGILLKMLVSP